MIMIKNILKLFVVCVIIYLTLVFSRIQNNKQIDYYFVESYHFEHIKLGSSSIFTSILKCRSNVVYSRKFTAIIPNKNIYISGYICERGLFFDDKFLKIERN